MSDERQPDQAERAEASETPETDALNKTGTEIFSMTEKDAFKWAGDYANLCVSLERRLRNEQEQHAETCRVLKELRALQQEKPQPAAEYRRMADDAQNGIASNEKKPAAEGGEVALTEKIIINTQYIVGDALARLRELSAQVEALRRERDQWEGRAGRYMDRAEAAESECNRLQAELAALKSGDSVVVPRPTQEMMEAGAKVITDYITRKLLGNDNTVACAVYAAMLTVAKGGQ